MTEEEQSLLDEKTDDLTPDENLHVLDDFSAIKANIEALLFTSADWMSITEIKTALTLDSEMMVKNALNELKEKFKGGFSFHIDEDGQRFRMALKAEFEDITSALLSGLEIPPSALKVLSVIAYEQPVTRTRMSEILGRVVREDVAFLFRNKFVTYEKRGIGKYFSVTKKFYEYFKVDADAFRQRANSDMKVFLDEEMVKEERELNALLKEQEEEKEKQEAEKEKEFEDLDERDSLILEEGVDENVSPTVEISEEEVEDIHSLKEK